MPVHSTLPLETLLKFKEEGKLYLCQEFIHHNPSALPAPIEWVNKKLYRNPQHKRNAERKTEFYPDMFALEQ